MSDDYVILKTRAEAEWFLDSTYTKSKFIPLVASPFAWWVLEKNNYPCQRFDTFFDVKDMYKGGMENFEAVNHYVVKNCNKLELKSRIDTKEAEMMMRNGWGDSSEGAHVFDTLKSPDKPERSGILKKAVFYVTHFNRVTRAVTMAVMEVVGKILSKKCLLYNEHIYEWREMYWDLWDAGYYLLKCRDDNYENVLKETKAVAVVFGIKTKESSFKLAEAAQKLNIPAISWQHGGYGVHPSPLVFYTEYLNTDYHFCWGKGVKETMDADPLNPKTCEEIPIGSVSLRRISGGVIEERKATKEVYDYLYLPMGFSTDFFYVNTPYPYHDNMVWEMQKKILDMFVGCERNRVCVKLHPSKSSKQMVVEYLDHATRYFQYPTRIPTVIKDEETVEDLIHKSKVIIVDYPSTTLLQAVATKKVVFVMTGFMKLNDDALALLRKRAYCCVTPEELQKMLHKYDHGEDIGQNPDVNNTEFLERYGVYTFCPRSKAIMELNRIVEKHGRGE